jgi:hypothetical protein
MKKVYSILAVPVLLGIGMLSACRHRDDRHFPDTPPAIIKVVINGPFAIVWPKSDRSKIIVFTPRDPQNIHVFYVNDLTNSHDEGKNYHFKLLPEGVKAASSLTVDPYLADFTAETGKWEDQKEYFVRIELPVPEKITFAPPLHQVAFANGSSGYMTTNFVLEYRVANPERVKVDSPELGGLHPLATAELQEQYAKLCAGPAANSRFHDSCIEIRNLLAQCAGPKAKVFFFGAGIPLEKQSKMNEFEESEHAVYFFNEVLLRSFPYLTSKKLALPEKTGQPGMGGPRGMLMQASLKFPEPHMRPLPVSAVIDCKAGGLVVTTTQ